MIYLLSGTFYLVSNPFHASPFKFYLLIFFSFFINPVTVDDWTIKREKLQNFQTK